MAISPLGALPPLRSVPSVLGAVQPIQPVVAPAPLAPAVQVDIQNSDRNRQEPPSPVAAAEPQESAAPRSTDAMERRLSIDLDTKSVVYQVVDPASGDIVVQLPDAVVLKARAYAEAAARTKVAENPIDRSA